MASPTAGPSRGAALVLVADRDHVVRELAEHFLVVAGFRVEIVLDGASALELARELRPDVVLTEVMLPRLDGLTLCRRLRADPATSDIPVVIFSVLAAGERAREAGAAAFLLKPLAERPLVDTIRGALQGPPLLRPEASA